MFNEEKLHIRSRGRANDFCYWCPHCKREHQKPTNFEEVAHLMFPQDKRMRVIVVALGNLREAVDQLADEVGARPFRDGGGWIIPVKRPPLPENWFSGWWLH